MAYLALYRKYRPRTFDEVRGQDHIVTTLKNQMNAGRIGHAYLFCGTRGTGKTSVAKLFAKAVNCENPVNGSPCGQCPVCRAIDSQVSMNVVELDAASNNGVDNIREIIDNVKYSPTEGKYKVFIIDEVHMLSQGAFNALLKTLEEPPSYVIFILATTEIHKIPITILSRCQRYDFKRITTDVIAGCLADLMKAESIEAEDKALQYVARTADGSMRDAQSLLDQCIAFYMGQKLTYDKVLEVLGSVDVEVFARLFRYIYSGQVDHVLGIIDEIMVAGRELGQFVNDFTWYLRNLLIARTTKHPEEVLEFSRENMELILHEAGAAEEEILIRYITILSELSNRIRFATQKRVLVEMELIHLARPEMDKDFTGIQDRIRRIEQKLENGYVAGNTQGHTTQENEKSASEELPDPAQQEAKKEMMKALPEDIISVVKNWQQIKKKLTSTSERMLNTIMTTSDPVYEDGKLVISLKDKTDVGTMYSKDRDDLPHRKLLVERIISETIGGSVEVVLKAADQIDPNTSIDLGEDNVIPGINMAIEQID